MSETSKSSKWVASQEHEVKRLASSNGWNFGNTSSLSSSPAPALSRTRGTSLKRAADDDNSAVSAKVSRRMESPVLLKKAPSPTAPTRLLLEASTLQSMMERHMKKCPKCGDSATVSFPTVCIASGIKIHCTNPMCDFIDLELPATADLPHTDDMGSPLIERTTDYAANIQYVLGFMACGDGGKEAERLLGFLGLPNATTMEKRSFPVIEGRLSSLIQELTDEILLENLDAAVKLHYGERRHDTGGQLLYDLWREEIKDNNNQQILPPDLYPRLVASADMAWQKRSSGRMYDSNSGWACLVEGKTRRPIAYAVRSKICAICKAHKDPTVAVRPHECMINHVGSSGSMEPLAILDMVVDLYDNAMRRVVITQLVTDDDSSIKAKLKWSNADHMLNHNSFVTPTIINRNGNETNRPDHGQLPRHMPEPTFVADPNHRKKTLKGELYRHLAKNKEQRCGLTKVDVMRIAQNFAYMIRTLKNKESSAEFVPAGQAVVEHHFDNHCFCGGFCKRKTLTAEQRKRTAKIYRSKTKDEKLYGFLTATVGRFVTQQALEEVGHGYDTQVNESLNNTVVWHAQKNKTYCGTSSLTNRICFALGIHSVGSLVFFERLFGKFGIPLSIHARHYLTQQQRTRVYRIDNYKKKRVKKNRNYKLHDRLREFSEKVKKQIAKKEGSVYQPGIGMEGGYCQPAAATAIPSNKRCSACGEAGHKMRTSKKCRLYKARGAAAPAAASLPTDNDEECTHDADEQALLDACGFAGESDDEFFDALEDDDDEDTMAFLV